MASYGPQKQYLITYNHCSRTKTFAEIMASENMTHQENIISL